MDFTLYSDLTPYLIGFLLVTAVSVVALLATLIVFFTENHAVRVSRHEGIFSYYGHLTIGH